MMDVCVGFEVTRGGVAFVNAIGDPTDENGLMVELVVTLTLPASGPFIGHEFSLAVASADESAVTVSTTSVSLGWMSDGSYVENVTLYYYGTDDLLVDGVQSTSVTLGPLVNMSSGEALSEVYTIRNITTLDNDGKCCRCIVSHV